MSLRYAVVIERGARGCSAFVPDLPGCIAAARTENELRSLIKEAIEFHLEGLRRKGEPIPKPTTHCEYVEAVAPAA